MKAWVKFLESQENEIGKETVDNWLRPSKILKFDACNLYLEVEDSFKAIWFEEHIRKKLGKLLLNNSNKPIKVHLSIAAKEASLKKKKIAPPLSSFKLIFDEIDPRCTFENFIKSSSNETAFQLFYDAVTKGSYNPLYLQGKKGSGKTHLLMAAAHFLREKGKKVLFIGADTFTAHVVMAIRQGEMEVFRKTYRNCDALIIDDVEVFSKKSATQEELFHTFNTLHVEGKAILLSSNFPPNELKLIEERLISRFEWGILICLGGLEKVDLKKLLLKHASELNFSLGKEMQEWLTLTFGSHSKALLKALNALVLRVHMKGEMALNPPKAKELLKDLILEEEAVKLTPLKIVRAVADYYGIRVEDILGKLRTKEVLIPRQISMYLCRQKLNLPFMKIGEFFSKDHSTVISSIQQLEKNLEVKSSDLISSFRNILKNLE